MAYLSPVALPQPSVPLKEYRSVFELNADDVEVKVHSVLTTKASILKNSVTVLDPRCFNSSSSLFRLKRSIVNIQRMIESRRINKQSNWRPTSGPPIVEEMKQAESLIIKTTQWHAFKEEIIILRNLNNKDMFKSRQSSRKRNENIKKISSLCKLDPFLDQDGLLRVGGRLNKSTMDYQVKHPLILPKTGHVTELFIRHFHYCDQHHQGRGMTHNAIRQAGYWIINGRSVVHYFIQKCVTCRKLRGRFQVQKMAELPAERATPSSPFTYSGMDVFGPWYIKERRSQLKRWGLIFTCLASRAVHLETLNTMESDSFINALRRFINRRGKIRQLYSDQGSNFVGARNELTAALKEIDVAPIKNFLLSQDCDWIDFKMNVPTASHMGGIWERLIRSVRSVLSSLLFEHGSQLDDEALRTLMTEAENIVNSRPLTTENLSDPDAPEPITPNHLLLMKSKVVLSPPGNFTRPDLYTRKRWRRVQYLADQFWTRWRREYCALQFKRQKWNNIKRSNQVGDIVLMCDEDIPRNKWPLARITKVYPSSDGLVRKVQLKQASGDKLLDRPIHKLILIFPHQGERILDQDIFPNEEPDKH